MNSLLVLFIILTLLLILVSGMEGLRNLFGLAINFVLIFAMLTMMAWGMNTFILLGIVSILILAVAIYMSSDDNMVTNISFKTSLIVVFSLFLVAVLVQHLGNLQGFAIEDTEELEELSLAIGLNFSNVAIVVMVISMLGAVAEAAMALVASLSEVVEQDVKMTMNQFTQQRIIISQQILGTAINTLFFGLLGSSLSLILWFVRLHYSFAEIINSKLLMADMAAMLLGMVGILFAIWLSGYFVEKEFGKTKKLKY
ncbi:YibE/F family protein [Lactococcus garvieae]|uniref:YibE/F family protein n=1 Tax=Lactococcus garvieae TaxID=1363 RepID=UPI0009C13F75|nr:YibE/F family protein [Lactococcus garvieae]